MSKVTSANIEMIRNWFKTLEKGNPEEMRQYIVKMCSEDYVLHDPAEPNLLPGLKPFMESFDKLIQSIKDMHVAIDDIFGEANKVVCRFSYSFTEMASNEKKHMTGIVISRFMNGKVVEEWQITAPVAVPAASPALA